jgi:hypothetical protein
MEPTERDTLAVLASILSDPAAASSRLKDLNAARDAANFAKLDIEKRLKEVKSIEAEANEVFKKASLERNAAAKALKDAEAARDKTQLLLDQIANREGEVGNREGISEKRKAELDKLQEDLRLKERQLAERDVAITAQEKQLATKLSELDRKLKALRAITV